MPAVATKSGMITSAWKDAANAYASVSVAEGGKTGTVEYTASTSLFLADASGTPDPTQPKPAAQLKADLVTAVSAVRAAQMGAAPTVVAISGTVTV